MAKVPAAVRPYMGYDPKVEDPWMKISFQRSRDATAAYYLKPTDADVQIFHGQVVLNETTAPYLYGGFTPAKMKIARGQYPKLDKVVDDLVVQGGQYLSDRMKVLKLLTWCRDIPLRGRTTRQYIAGGPEELIAWQGGNMCNEMNRVFMVMCQIAGFPSRYVGHFSAFKPGNKLEALPGHGVAEVYLEGKWAYFDIRGRHFEWPDGTLASLWDLVRNPDLYIHQRDLVKVLRDPRRNEWDSGQRLIMWPSLQVIANYDAATRKKCTYTPAPQTAARERLFAERSKKLTEAAREKLQALLKEGYRPPCRTPWD